MWEKKAFNLLSNIANQNKKNVRSQLNKNRLTAI